MTVEMLSALVFEIIEVLYVSAHRKCIASGLLCCSRNSGLHVIARYKLYSRI